MRIYTTDQNEKNLYIYKYQALKNELYQYKKEKMLEEKYQLFRASYTSREQYFFLEKESSSYLDIILSNVSCTEEEKNDILEQYYNGLMDEYRYCFVIDSPYFKEGAILLPKNYQNMKVSYVVHVPNSLVLLKALEDANFEYVYNHLDELNEQTKCFKFDINPIDMIKTDSLRVMFNDSHVDIIIRKAKENTKVLEHIRRI